MTMYTLVELFAEAKRLVESDDKKKLEKLNALFDDPRAPAELVVVRHFIAARLAKDITDQLGDLDPKKRLAAIQAVRLAFPAALAGNLLRRVVRDPNGSVKSRARLVINEMQLGTIRPPGARFTADAPATTGDPTAWAFGIFANEWADGKKPTKPKKVNAIAKHKLPNLGSDADIGKLIGVAPGELPSLMRPGTGKGSAYIEFEVPKAKGGTRRIAAPRDTLRKAQRKISTRSSPRCRCTTRVTASCRVARR